MGKYLDYTKYVLEHKKNVFKTCWKRGLYIHAFTHDLSKFSPSEFFPYAEWFDGEYGVKFKVTDDTPTEDIVKHKDTEEKFDRAWEHHYEHNKHHWKHWCYDWDEYYDGGFVELEDCKLEEPKTIPFKYIEQMVCDWEAMSIKFGGTAQQYYLENYFKLNLSEWTRWRLENMLELYSKTMECDEEYWMSIGAIYKRIVEKYNDDPCNTTEPEIYINEILYTDTNEKFDINIYDMIKESYEKEI